MNKSIRILVVDDDDSIRTVLKAILEDEGYIVDLAENGKEAIEKSNIIFYNMALIDFKLPDMDGTELLGAMKETTPKMIKIIITGYPTLQNAVNAVNEHADGYIIKPLNMENLLKTIKKHLKKYYQAKKYSVEKVAEFIETRAKELGHIHKPHR
ncbi:response regulator [Candidatus Bathyarchaeota archaeon]|nr:MAG: response regulator [Candidatus Bathyarchaeota archaeon]